MKSEECIHNNTLISMVAFSLNHFMVYLSTYLERKRSDTRFNICIVLCIIHINIYGCDGGFSWC